MLKYLSRQYFETPLIREEFSRKNAFISSSWMTNNFQLKGLNPPYFFHCDLSKVKLNNFGVNDFPGVSLLRAFVLYGT